MEYETQREYREKALDAMTEEATLSYPPATLDQEIHFLMDERENYYRAYGIQSTEDYLRMMGKTHEEYHEELRPAAQTRLERKLVLDAIAEREQFEISDYELEQYLADMLGHDPEELESTLEQLAKSENYRNFITSLIQREHAEELFIASAKGEEVPEPGQHPVLEAPVEELAEAIAEELDEAVEESAVAEDDEVVEIVEVQETFDESGDAEETPESAEAEETSQSITEEEDTVEA